MNNKQPCNLESGWKLRFWAVFGGQALSLIGSALTQFVLLWWITDTTGSLLAVATAGMAALLPQALFGPLGGVFADRHSRRWLMIAADSISALCMMALIALFITERVELWHAYALMAIRSVMQAFQAPAAMASVTMLVPDSFLIRASGLNQSLQSLTLVAAAPLGALAISVMPIGWALIIDVVTALLAIVPLLCFRIPQAFAPGHRKPSLWREFQAGVALIVETPGLSQLYALLAVVIIAVMPTFTLVPLLVKDHFGGGAGQVALMEGLSGIGMVVGGLLVAVSRPRRPIHWILFGFATSSLALGLTALVPNRLFSVAVAWWVISGICFVFGNAPMTALLQRIIPNAMQGRALSLLNTLTGLSAPVGLIIVVPLSEAFGVREIFVIAGFLGAVASLAGFFSPALLALAESDRHRQWSDRKF